MGVFARNAARAKAAFGSNYGKEGRYWVIINNGKNDNHATKNSEQNVYEGTVLKVLDPGPPAGQRWPCTDGGNETAHSPGDPFTFHFGSWTLGAEGRLKKFILVATGIDERKLPPSVLPVPPYSDLKVAPGTAVWAPPDPRVGQPVPGWTVGMVIPGGAVAAMDPIENAIELSTSPSVNALRDYCLEVVGHGINTTGRATGGVKKKIIAVDPIKRVWAREVRECWDQLHENAKLELNKDRRLELMLPREEQERQMMAAQLQQQPAGK